MDSTPGTFSWVARQRYLLLFAALVLVLFFNTFLGIGRAGKLVLWLGLVGVSLGSLRAMWRRPALSITVCGLLAARVAGALVGTPQSIAAADLATLLLFTVVIFGIVVDVLTTPEVGADTVFGACSIYLLMGLAWAMAYTFLEGVTPGSFTLGGGPLANDHTHRTAELVYFSYVTLSTVGFGDVLPAARETRGLAVMEALAGQLYLAIMIARMVTLHAARHGPSAASTRDRAA